MLLACLLRRLRSHRTHRRPHRSTAPLPPRPPTSDHCTAPLQDEDAHMTLRQILATSRGRITVACDLLALVGMAPFVVIEVGAMRGCGRVLCHAVPCCAVCGICCW